VIIRTATVENWRAITSQQVRFGEGLNVVIGPNEAGKSSLMEAMYHAIAGDPHSAKREYHSLVPWNTKVKARVSLDLQSDDEGMYRVAKAFPKGGAALYYLADGEERLIAEEKATDAELLRRLGLGEELKGILDLLWVRQGEGTDLLRDRRRGVADPVVRMVKDVTRGRLLAPAAERFFAELQRERQDIFTSRGLKGAAGSRGAEIARLQDEYERLVEEEKAVYARQEELEAHRRRYEELYRENEELEDRVRKAERRLRSLEEKQKRYAEWQRLDARVQPLSRALTGYRRKEQDRNAALQRLGELRRALAVTLEDEIAGLEQRQSELEEREGEIASLEEALAASPRITREQVNEAESAAGELSRTETLLEKQPIRVELTPYTEQHVRISEDGGETEERTLSDPLGLTVSRSFTVEKPGELSLSVTGPLSAEEHVSLTAQRDSLRERLDEILSSAGAENLKQLKELYEQRREQESRLQSLRSAVEDQDRQTLERRIAEMQRTRQELAGRKAGNEDSGKACQDGGGPQGSGDYAGLSSAELEQRIAREESTAAAAEEGLQEALEQSGISDLSSLESEHKRARQAAEEKREELAVMEPLEVEEVDQAAVEKARRELETLRDRLGRGREEKARLEGELGSAEDHDEQLAEYAYRKRRTEEALRREWTDVYAVEALLSAMQQEKERLEQRIYEPLEEKIGKAFAELTGERYGRVDIDSDMSGLGVYARTYDGGRQAVPPSDLSFGTREQLSFLFRLAVAEALSERQRQVMVLDDSFVNSDPQRLHWLLEETARAASRMQCILFTCSGLSEEELPEGTRYIRMQ
jgi:exonuclease SbcC